MSHYITCHNCGEPECMDSDTGVHRRDDGTVCPDPRDEALREAKGRADRCERAYHRAMNAARLIAQMVPEAQAAAAQRYVAAAESREADEAARAQIAEVEGLRAEVARLRAAAFPEDAEEIVFKELSIGVFEPQDLEIQEAIHAKRRAKARAVVKALRGNA